MVKTGPEPIWLTRARTFSQSSTQFQRKSNLSLHWLFKEVYTKAVRDGWEMEIRSNVKFSEVMTRTNLEKFYHNLNEKLIPTTNSLEDSA